MTRDAFRRKVAEGCVVILPFGATEAHGAHLPLGTDTFQPAHVADAVAERMGNVLVAPAMPYGNHSSTKNMPGTIWLAFDTVRAFTRDVLTALHGDGVRAAMILSGHAGSSHLCAIKEGCKDVVDACDMKVSLVSEYDVGASHPKVRDLAGDGHGGLVETSRMLDIKPEAVTADRPVGTYSSTGSLVVRDASVCFPEGMAGDTGPASAELGREINSYIIDSIVGVIRRDLL